jgi:BirA family biotin operon repressor/biotin-[acetyl-CoA-carboxylase] ligase
MDTHYDIIHRAEVASTQEEAASAFRLSGRPVLVVADRQVRGRGRAGRAWIEPDVGMYASLSVVPAWPPHALSLIPLVAAVAARRSIASITGVEVDLKWPNDLLVGGHKVGGILVERSDGIVTVGCGVNLVWVDPPAYAAALLEGHPDEGVAMGMATSWVDAIVGWLDRPVDDWPRDEYVAACITLGHRIRWSDGEGIADGIDHAGALLVSGGGGRRRILSGDVHLLTES